MLTNSSWPRLFKRVQMQGGPRWADEAYIGYAAASAGARQRRRWAFLSSLLVGEESLERTRRDDGALKGLDYDEIVAPGESVTKAATSTFVSNAGFMRPNGRHPAL